MAGGRVSHPNEKENTRLKRLVADLSLEKQVLKGEAVQ